MNNDQLSYLRIAYWAIRMFEADFESNFKVQIIKKLKEFLYFIILDIGISPFVKFYEGKSLLFAAVQAKQTELLKELLSHTYELQD